ncbi:MAG: sodium:calcium antiporter [Candidatus Bathyarchaeota archaeon]|nr:sodium:calcium antiporter [Candidatus Bathyarchaeota archaeon]
MAETTVSTLIINVVIIAVAFLVLNWASNVAIQNALKVSRITRLGKTAVGFTLIAFSTSLPELTVAVAAVISGGAPLSVGNVLGSNIVNICLVVGLATLIIYLRYSRKGNKDKSKCVSIVPTFAKQELSNIHFGLLVSSIIPLGLIYVGNATWAVGFVLISICAVYMFQMAKVRIPEEDSDPVTDEEKSKLRRFVMFTILGAIGVVISANFLVESAVVIAGAVGIPQTIVGATIVAIGTSLPELTLDLKAFLGGHSALALGDIIGSSFMNITLILGITLFLPAVLGRPIVMNMSVYENLVIFSIITNLFFWYFLSQGKISWKEGAIFLCIYALFIYTTIAAASAANLTATPGIILLNWL